MNDVEFIIIAIIALIVIAVILFRLFPIIEVIGNSMYPTYKDGETLFARRYFDRSSIKIGDVVVYKHDNRYVIKRVANVVQRNGITLLYCLGDNAEESYDSRQYGFISIDKVMCKPFSQRY